MAKIIEAIYEDGVLKPVGSLPLKEHQRIRITLEETFTGEGDILNLAANVYRGLSLKEIEEIEAIALNRSNFSREGV